ncbi:MAG: nucleotidyl transferase AbiEii/AbiGii toxin family protein [Desulfobacterales bacterium]|nr:nucleotidyl transferase AbiEii/AbiGii toxin family protein [Desulfobacterales bacterium]
MNMGKKKFEVFDPNPSIKFALKLFSKTNISQFALIGKLAMWVYMDDESQHEYTKDVDFAVNLKEISTIETQIVKQGLTYKNLYIGGIAIREKGLNIDFIDRRLNGIDPMFIEAIQEASIKVSVDHYSIPVVSIEHLIAMKMVSGEPKDDKDVKKLLSLMKANYKKTKSIVTKYLGAITAERLDVFAREAGILPKNKTYLNSC